jgi:hypothetical protein
MEDNLKDDDGNASILKKVYETDEESKTIEIGVKSTYDINQEPINFVV